MIKHTTIEQEIKANGDRHKANGDKYLIEGKLKHAAGSYRKAARNYERAYKYTLDFVIDTISEPWMKKFQQNVSDTVLYGCSTFIIDEDGNLKNIDLLNG